MAREIKLPMDTVNQMVDTFGLVCAHLETYRLKDVKSGTKEFMTIFMGCVADADYATKMQHGYMIKEIHVDQV